VENLCLYKQSLLDGEEDKQVLPTVDVFSLNALEELFTAWDGLE
jgi:hypothetical protein